MMEMQEFQQKLQELLEKASRQEKNLSHEDILDSFGLNQLSAIQLQSLYEYLKLQGIRIQGTDLGDIDLEGKILPEEAAQMDGNTEMNSKEPVELAKEDEACLKEYRDYEKLLEPEKSGEKERLLKEQAENRAAEMAGRSGKNIGKKSGNSIMERLAQLYLPVILAYARELYRTGIFIGDLIQEGNMGLLTIAWEELPENGADDWVKKQIFLGMKRWIEEQTRQKLQDDSVVERVRKLEAAIREISDDDNQKFSIEELSAYLEMDEEEIRAVLNLTGEGTEEEQQKGK